MIATCSHLHAQIASAAVCQCPHAAFASCVRCTLPLGADVIASSGCGAASIIHIDQLLSFPFQGV
eukprot:11576819-Karenia_brevis.AAC.1